MMTWKRSQPLMKMKMKMKLCNVIYYITHKIFSSFFLGPSFCQ
uniref:Uncharacterized protein n=1 Tax=Rhizophora mucronata TaxID=61149 RepID=A0A2P2NJ18_RHIMU